MHTAGNLNPEEETGKEMTAAWDSTGLCLLAASGLGMEEVMPMLMAAAGTGYAPFQFLTIGERIFNLQRLFNLKAGLRLDDEKLSERFYKDPCRTAPMPGRC